MIPCYSLLVSLSRELEEPKSIVFYGFEKRFFKIMDLYRLFSRIGGNGQVKTIKSIVIKAVFENLKFSSKNTRQNRDKSLSNTKIRKDITQNLIFGNLSGNAS